MSASSARAVLPAALRLLRRRAGAAYAAAALATAVNTVPDVLRQVLVWSSPSALAAFAVDVVGFLTALVAQVWVVGALVPLVVRDAAGGGGAASWSGRGALRRGLRSSAAAVRAAPVTVLAGVVTGGAVSALVTLPASVVALGWRSVLGPLGDPSVGAFAVAAVSDVAASALTLPYLALVVVPVAARATGPAGVGGPAGGRERP